MGDLAPTLQPVAVSAPRAGLGIGGVGHRQHLDELPYFLIGHFT
jgi:hypothetical protein